MPHIETIVVFSVEREVNQEKEAIGSSSRMTSPRSTSVRIHHLLSTVVSALAGSKRQWVGSPQLGSLMIEFTKVWHIVM